MSQHDTTTINADEARSKNRGRSLHLMIAQERRRAGEELQRAVGVILDPRNDGFVDMTEILFHLKATLDTLGFNVEADMGRDIADPGGAVSITAVLTSTYTP